MNKKTLKSIGAVLAGFITVFILSVATDAIIEGAGIFPPPTQPGEYVWWMLLTALIYRSIYAVAGGYVAARLAPNRPMRHTMILAIIGCIFAILGLVGNLGMSTPATIWYPIMLVVLTIPSVWLGGKLFVMKKSSK